MAFDNQLEALKTSIGLDKPPYCSGVLTPPHSHDFYLYYGLDKPTFIDLANASTEDLTALTEACDPATFGLGGEDVLDETYRKAVKLDASKFAITFNPACCDLIGAIKEQLFQVNVAASSLDCELSKLNIYGKDAFFKPHKDTPRSENMVGSLVIVFPTPHSGGELVLRKDGKEWTFDGASLISSQPSPSIAYIAFYSDVEHEVLKVTSGHRITITYNLYHSPREMIGTQEFSTPIVQDLTGVTDLKRTLESMLQDKDFMPEGGNLGFGLKYQYPIAYEAKISDLKGKLKGSDAHIWNACSDLGLEPNLWVIYAVGESIAHLDHIRVLAEKYYKTKVNHAYEPWPFSDVTHGGRYVVNSVNGIEAREEWLEWYGLEGSETMQVTWVSGLASVGTLAQPIMTYGNEGQMTFVYCDPCLLATVKPASERG